MNALSRCTFDCRGPRLLFSWRTRSGSTLPTFLFSIYSDHSADTKCNERGSQHLGDSLADARKTEKFSLPRIMKRRWSSTPPSKDIFSVSSPTSLSTGRERMTTRPGFRLARHIRNENRGSPYPPSVNEGREQVSGEHREQPLHLEAEPDTILGDLKHYVFENYGFGPFIYRDIHTNREISRANNLRELQTTLARTPIATFVLHSNRNDFSPAG